MASLDEIDVLVAFILDHVVEGGELFEAIVSIVASLRQITDYQLLHLDLVTHARREG